LDGGKKERGNGQGGKEKKRVSRRFLQSSEGDRKGKKKRGGEKTREKGPVAKIGGHSSPESIKESLLREKGEKKEKKGGGGGKGEEHGVRFYDIMKYLLTCSSITGT